MSTKRKISGQNWEFDGSTITVRIPVTWKPRGGRKVIIAPDGGDAWAPAKLRPDETLIRALARAHRWKRLIEDETYRSAAEIAGAEKVTRSFVNRLLRLTLLAPDIVEAILEGRQPKTMQLEELTDAVPSEWEKQRKALFPNAGAEAGRFSPRLLRKSVVSLIGASIGDGGSVGGGIATAYVRRGHFKRTAIRGEPSANRWCAWEGVPRIPSDR